MSLIKGLSTLISGGNSLTKGRSPEYTLYPVFWIAQKHVGYFTLISGHEMEDSPYNTICELGEIPFVIVVYLVVWKIGGWNQPKYYLAQKSAARSENPTLLLLEIHHFWWVWGVPNYHRAHHIINFTQPISTICPSTATDASRRFLSASTAPLDPNHSLTSDQMGKQDLRFRQVMRELILLN